MAYDLKVAERIRERLANLKVRDVEEKKAFGGLVFMVKDKMCVCASGEKLMCRFDPALQEKISNKKGFEPMIMRGKEVNGYCYILPEGFKAKKNFEYWIDRCLDYNDKAQSPKKKSKQ